MDVNIGNVLTLHEKGYIRWKLSRLSSILIAIQKTATWNNLNRLLEKVDDIVISDLYNINAKYYAAFIYTAGKSDKRLYQQVYVKLKLHEVLYVKCKYYSLELNQIEDIRISYYNQRYMRYFIKMLNKFNEV